MLHERFAHPEENDSEFADATLPSSLLVPIDAQRLSILYTFRDHHYAKGIFDSETFAPGSQVIPNATLVDLADLLTTKLPEHQDPALRAAHWEAEKLVPHLATELRNGSIVTIRPMGDASIEL
ncbi:hypothetical protein BTHE68_39200 [Burkholderia sp. THE68]|nr:hypothetical protein BTHE68_39200 [Burkholderia sp. THE68]